MEYKKIKYLLKMFGIFEKKHYNSNYKNII